MSRLRLAVPGTVQGCLEVVKVRGIDELVCRCVGCGEEFIVPRESFFSGRGARPEVLDCLGWKDDCCPHWYSGRHFGVWTCRGIRNGKAEMLCECGRWLETEDDGVLTVGETIELFDQDEVCPHKQGIYQFVRFGWCDGMAYVKCSSCGEVIAVGTDAWKTGEYAVAHPVCDHVPDRRGCFEFRDYADAAHEVVELECQCSETELFSVDDYKSMAFAARFLQCPHSVVGEAQGCLRAKAIEGIDKLRCVCVECGAGVVVSWADWESGAVAELHPSCSH